MPTIKKLYIASGLNIAAPTDLNFESSTNHIVAYASDAAYVAANGSAVQGDTYLNTVSLSQRAFLGGSWVAVGGGGVRLFKTANYTASDNDFIACDTTLGGFTITLPASPNQGVMVTICDGAGYLADKPVTIDRNGSKIIGLNENFVININWVKYNFIYNNSTVGWTVVR